MTNVKALRGKVAALQAELEQVKLQEQVATLQLQVELEKEKGRNERNLAFQNRGGFRASDGNVYPRKESPEEYYRRKLRNALRRSQQGSRQGI